MKKILVGLMATLFLTFSFGTLSASVIDNGVLVAANDKCGGGGACGGEKPKKMKCGQGKCGDGKCGAAKGAKCNCDPAKCPVDGKCTSKDCKCPASKAKSAKCGQGKCGGEKKKMKCGAGKCGSN